MNISSILLLTPLIATRLMTGEKLALIFFALASLAYHTSREHDRVASGKFTTLSSFLYKLDHTNIQLGLVYLLDKSTDMTTYAFVVANALTDYRSSSDILTAVLVSVDASMTMYRACIFDGLVLCVALSLAAYGYRGTASSTVTRWHELDKCLWHGGVGVALGIMIKWSHWI